MGCVCVGLHAPLQGLCCRRRGGSPGRRGPWCWASGCDKSNVRIANRRRRGGGRTHDEHREEWTLTWARNAVKDIPGGSARSCTSSPAPLPSPSPPSHLRADNSRRRRRRWIPFRGKERREAESVEDAGEEALSASEESPAMWEAPSIERGPAGVEAPLLDLLPCLVDRLHIVPGTGSGPYLASSTGSRRRLPPPRPASSASQPHLTRNRRGTPPPCTWSWSSAAGPPLAPPPSQASSASRPAWTSSSSRSPATE